jgi:hypothetical protein
MERNMLANCIALRLGQIRNSPQPPSSSYSIGKSDAENGKPWYQSGGFATSDPPSAAGPWAEDKNAAAEG